MLAAALALVPSAQAAGGVKYRSDQATFGSSSTKFVPVHCPAKTRVVGGGGVVTYPQVIIRPPILNVSAPMDGADSNTRPDDAWQVVGVAPSDQRLEGYVSCLSTKLGKPAIATAAASVEAEAATRVSVTCPAGTRVTGGGVFVTGAADEANIAGSGPIDGGIVDDADALADDGWSAGVNNFTGADKSVRVTAFCLKQGKRKLRYPSETGSGADKTVDCPAGSRVLSGGMLLDLDEYFPGSRPADGPDGDSKPNDAWRSIGDGTNATVRTAWAICRAS